MGWIDWTVSILTVVVGIILTIVVMLQTSKTGGSVVSGDSSNTFYCISYFSSNIIMGFISIFFCFYIISL